MISGIVTAVLMILFLGVCVWAYSAKNRPRFEAAAQLPLNDEPVAAPACERSACGCSKSD